MAKAKQRRTKEQICDALEHLRGISTELRFMKFLGKTDDKIVVRYAGHGEAGSYVYATSVMPDYVKTLQKITNRHVDVKHNTRDGGFGFDAYDCTIYLKKVISADEEKRNTVGQLIYADGYYAFRVCAGRVWAMCYGILERATDSKFINATGLDISKRDKDIITYNDKEIFKKLDRQPSHHRHFKGHNTDSNRTFYSATFDLYIDESELGDIFLELTKESLNYNLKLNDRDYEVDEIYFRTPEYQSEHIMYTFTNTVFNELGPRVGHLPSIAEKQLMNEDYSVQCWAPGSEMGDCVIDNKQLINIKIEEFNYNIKEGPSYSIRAGIKGEANSTAFKSLSHVEMMKHFKPQFEKDVNIDFYHMFIFPGFMSKEDSECRLIEYLSRDEEEVGYHKNYGMQRRRHIDDSQFTRFKARHFDLTQPMGSYNRVPSLSIGNRYHGDEGMVTRFNEVKEKVIVQNVFDARHNMELDQYDAVSRIKKRIREHISSYRKNEQELEDMSKVMKVVSRTLRKRQEIVYKDIERDLNTNKDSVSKLIIELTNVRKVNNKIIETYDRMKEIGLFDTYNIDKVSENYNESNRYNRMSYFS